MNPAVTWRFASRPHGLWVEGLKFESLVFEGLWFEGMGFKGLGVEGLWFEGLGF